MGTRETFGKHKDFIVRQDEPFNGGAPLEHLRREFLTPVEHFYVRNHGDAPEIDARAFRLSVEGYVIDQLSLSLDELKNNFPKVSVEATMQCAGNRRDELMQVEEVKNEVPWGAEAIGNAVWSGALLRDVLLTAGVDDNYSFLTWHVAFLGADTIEKHGAQINFGASVSIEKALHGDVLLAYEMNGAPLTRVHGAPLRVVVPGFIGARSVKWLDTVTVKSEPSDNYYQAHAYKMFPSDVRAETADWASTPAIEEQATHAVICRPAQNEKLPKDTHVTVEGYATNTEAEAGRQITGVEISTDAGATWQRAALSHEGSKWTWTFWHAELSPLSKGAHEIIARVLTDAPRHEQPAEVASVWNFKGYMNDAWHRIQVEVAD